MTTTHRTRTTIGAFTDLVITGTAADIAALTAAARLAGVLVYRSAARPAAPGDPRLRALLRLRLHHP